MSQLRFEASEAMHALLNRDDPHAVEARRTEGSECVVESARMADVKFMKLLFDRCADPKSDGNSCAVTVAFGGQIEAMELLPNVGISLDAKGKEGNTLLGMAAGAYLDNSRFLEWAAKAGADLKAVDSRGHTAPHSAGGGIGTSIERLRMLLKLGLAVDTTDRSGKTALHLAAQSGKAEFVRVLLKAGANRQLRDAPRLEPVLEEPQGESTSTSAGATSTSRSDSRWR